MARPRLLTGRLTFSTNTLRGIMSRRLEVKVRFTKSYRIVSQEVIDINRENSSKVAKK